MTLALDVVLDGSPAGVGLGSVHPIIRPPHTSSACRLSWPRSPSGLLVVDVLEFGVHDVAVLRRRRSLLAVAGAAPGLTIHRLRQLLGRARQALLRAPDAFDVVSLQSLPGVGERLLDRGALGVGDLRSVLG